MKQKLLLLLAISMLILQACLSAPNATEIAVNGQTPAPESIPSPTPQPTAMPSYLSQLRVAYILNGNVWVWDSSTGARQLTNESFSWRPKISSDGQVVVYQQEITLYSVNIDGTNTRKIVDLAEFGRPTNIIQFEFQINTHNLFFTKNVSINDTEIELYSIEPESPINGALLAFDAGNFNFSPDGRLIALSTPTGIKIMDVDGVRSVITAFSYSPINQNSIADYLPQTVWMKDASGLYTVIPSETKSRFLYISSDGAIQAQLAEFASEGPDISQPVISPDGTKVAYVTKRDTTYELHIIDAATIDTIIASYDNPPMFELYGWSPDSKRVTFSISDPLFVFAAGIGLPPALLTESAAPDSLRWVDADHFIFFREGRLLVGQVGSSQIFEIATGFDRQMQTTNFYDFVLLPSP